MDDALGAEEMVEKLTDKNLGLEERIETLEETVSDLEALRDIAEEQEELRVEVEHDMREELDMQLNKTREVCINKISTGIHNLNNLKVRIFKKIVYLCIHTYPSRSFAEGQDVWR